MSWARDHGVAAAATGLGLWLAFSASVSAAPKPPAPISSAATPGATRPAGTQPAKADGSRDPVDITAEHSEVFQDEHRVVYTGDVEAIWGQDRLRTPQLNIFFTKHDPSARDAKAPPAPGGAPSTFGKIDRMEADGTVYFTTPTQNAKGDHGTYLGAPDTITLLGNVVLVQDKNVSTGDKLVIDRRTNHSTLYASSGAASAPGSHRVRGVFYQDQTNTTSTPAPPSTVKPSPPPPGRP